VCSAQLVVILVGHKKHEVYGPISNKDSSMKKIYLFATLISALVVTQLTLAADSCNKVGQVSGRINTVNLSDKVQTGSIVLKIKVNHIPYYFNKGRIIGRTIDTGIDANTGQPYAIMEHNMFFGWQTILATNNDTGLLTPTRFLNGVPCAFDVTEKISEGIGTNRLKVLSNHTHEVIAKGSFSFCPDNNRNILKLSGTVCLD
jgi:hypothetical protein